MTPIVRRAIPAGVVVVAALAFLIAGFAPTAAGSSASFAVTWGLPIARMIVDLAIATTIGSVVLALWVLTGQTAAYRRALYLAAGASFVATVFAIVTLLFTFVRVSQLPLSFSSSFGDGLAFFVTSIGIGQAWLAVILISATATVLLMGVTNQTAVFFVGLLALSALLPLPLQRHGAGSTGHATAITSLGLHLVFVSIWVGGLVALVFVRSLCMPADFAQFAKRYSTLALVAFIVVGATGVVSAWLRLGSLENLASPYGVLVLAKTLALIALGALGFWQRSRALERVSRQARGAFTGLVIIELAVLGAAMGLAQALSRTAPPVSQELTGSLTPAEILTGEPLPPPLTFSRYLTEWSIDPLWLLVCAFGIFFYIAGVVRLRRRGDAWPWHRAVLWTLGLLLLFYVTNGGVKVYGHYLFTAHMAAHMSLSMMVPILLVAGAPVTLAMRAIHKRDDGSRGSREWILLAVHSRYGRFISHPIFATINFVGSLWIFYYTPIFRWAITDHIGHEWMVIHFLLAGYLFVQSLIGIDPGPSRLRYPLRLVQLFAAMTVHAFFGLSIMSGEGLLLADWFGAMGRTWGDAPLVDQQAGGAIAWSVGEIPNVVIAVLLAMQWGRDEGRIAKRLDRQAERDDNADLRAYNEMLGGLTEQDNRQDTKS
ncbi:MAG: bifunctional copper resistance protein CopD/cytochrome c oxidase assembly protein [Aurantimicrobium sp.]|nr:bifunctional copper resistance protein CopD/cytochrome c oxidase assembly protein [Aurantimicrobium sp.]